MTLVSGPLTEAIIDCVPKWCPWIRDEGRYLHLFLVRSDVTTFASLVQVNKRSE